MNYLVKNIRFFPKCLSRPLSCTQSNLIRQWFIDRGLPPNRTAEGVLTDTPDFTYLDGRPTPLLHKQKKRMLLQQEFAAQIVQLTSELDFAKKRRQEMLKKEEADREYIIKNRLQKKGRSFNETTATEKRKKKK